MAATNLTATSSAQWIFPVSALQYTPSRMTSDIDQAKELYDRARGVEFLFRLGVSLQLPLSAMYTAATWFHRFYMRYSMEDYHRQDVATSCIFLATKTEECGRKLRDVAKVFYSKVSRIDINDIADDNKELDAYQAAILLTEEVLLEALCFDFVVENPHTQLVDLFNARQADIELEECTWSIANDTARTPLCILFSSKIIAAACYILAQRILEGPESPSLDIRIASPAPSASLPTPPSHKFSSPEASRFAIEFFDFNEVDLAGVAEALNIILEFYAAQDLQSSAAHLKGVASIPPLNISATRPKLYATPESLGASASQGQATSTSQVSGEQTPMSAHGGNKAETTQGWKPVRGTS